MTVAIWPLLDREMTQKRCERAFKMSCRPSLATTVLQTVPEATRYATIEVSKFSAMSATYVEPKWWSRLSRAVGAAQARPEVAGVVIAHGTDTMEETAQWLDLTVTSDKAVVLIGAQRNASSGDFDGPRNLLNATQRNATQCASRAFPRHVAWA